MKLSDLTSFDDQVSRRQKLLLDAGSRHFTCWYSAIKWTRLVRMHAIRTGRPS